MESLDGLIKENRILVCVGSGGVGKTTVAAALGLRGRQLGKRVLVLTIDPAKRLASSLGLDLSSGRECLVPCVQPTAGTGTLHAAVINSKAIFDGFIAKYAADEELLNRLSKNRLYQQLSTTLSGSQEFTALARLLQASTAEYDLIILDTPPAQHAIDFLSAPDRIRGLFQESITKWFAGKGDSRKRVLGTGIAASLLGRGTRLALKSLELLTGARFIEELIDFFQSVRTVQNKLREQIDAAGELLRSQSSVFVLVTSFDVAKLKEAEALRSHLNHQGYHLGGCVINRAFPEGVGRISKSAAEMNLPESVQPSLKKLYEYYELLELDSRDRMEQFYLFEQNVRAHNREGAIVIKKVPEFRQDIVGLDDLEGLAELLSLGDF